MNYLFFNAELSEWFKGISDVIFSVVPSLSEIKENLNRPLTKLLSLFFDVLDALTLERVEQVGERKYMMEEDFRITAKHLKAATRPGK